MAERPRTKAGGYFPPRGPSKENALKRFCIRGHDLADPAVCHVWTDGLRRVHRQCRICNRQRKRKDTEQ